MRRGSIAVLLAIAAMAAQPLAQATCIDVPADGVIRAAGRYCLAADLTTARPIGIEVTAANVTLDLRQRTLRAERDAAGSIGVRLRDGAQGARLIGAIISGFGTGVSNAAAGARIEAVTFRDIGAIAIQSTGDGAELRGNVVESVGRLPLESTNAYAIGANLTGRGVVFQRNTIRDVRRQPLPAAVVGEAVGVLVGNDCMDCTVAENTLAKLGAEAESIGIWNSGTGKIEIRHNTVSGFDQGVITLGRQFAVHANTISCAGGATTTGVLMSLGRSGAADGEGAVFANRFNRCAIEQLMCDNGCKAPWILELVERLRRLAKPNE